MSSVTALPMAAAVDSQLKFSIERHPHHERLRHITVQPDALQKFFSSVKDIDLQNLEYVPFMRFMVADALERAVGDGFASALRQLVRDRSTGGFTWASRTRPPTLAITSASERQSDSCLVRRITTRCPARITRASS
jgi:CsiD.